MTIEKRTVETVWNSYYLEVNEQYIESLKEDLKAWFARHRQSNDCFLANYEDVPQIDMMLVALVAKEEDFADPRANFVLESVTYDNHQYDYTLRDWLTEALNDDLWAADPDQTDGEIEDNFNVTYMTDEEMARYNQYLNDNNIEIDYTPESVNDL